jgi:hypothetical protein
MNFRLFSNRFCESDAPSTRRRHQVFGAPPLARRRVQRKLSRFESAWRESQLERSAPWNGFRVCFDRRGGGENILALQSLARDGSLSSAQFSLARGADR